MELTTYGKSENPAVLLVPGGSLSSQDLYRAVQSLESRYFLVLACPDASLSPEERGRALEKLIREDFSGWIWGAYGLAEGGEALLELLRLGTVRVRTVVVENCRIASAPASLSGTSAALHCWVNNRDRAAKKCAKSLKAAQPSLHTLTLKKLKPGQCFADKRTDLMCKSLRRVLGTAKTVRATTLMPSPVWELWDHLPYRSEPRAARLLTETDAPQADQAHRVYVTGGRGKLVKLWSHRVSLEDIGAEETLCTDQIEVDAGLLTPLAGWWAKQYLKNSQRKQRRILKARHRKSRRH